MPRHRRIASLGLQTLASQVVIYTSGFVSSVIIARSLGPHGRGLYALPIALVTIACSLASQGLDLAQVRLWGRAAAARAGLATSAAWLAGLAGTLAAALVLAAYEAGRSGFFAGVPLTGMLVLVALMPLYVHTVLMRGLLVMDGDIAAANRALVAGDLCRTAGVIVLYLAGGLTVEAVVVLFGVTMLVPWAIALRALGPGRIGRRPPRRLMLEQISLGAKLAPYSLFLLLNLRLDILLVAVVGRTEQVGLYSIAVLVAELVWLPTWALSQAVKERQANADPPAAVAVTARAVRMTLLVALLLALAVAILAPAGMALVFGHGFEPAVAAVWALLPASVAMAAWRVVAPALVRFDSGWAMPWIALCALVVNVAANVALIPALGVVGAGLASSASYGCGALLAVARLRRSGGLAASELVPGRAELDELTATLRPASLRRQLAGLRAGEVSS